MIDCLNQYLCNATLQACIEDSCDNPMFSGMKERAFIINKSDINTVATDPNNPNIITDITFNSGVTNPVFVAINARNNPFTGTNIAVEVGDYRNTFTRTVSLFVPMDGGAVIDTIINPLANGKFVVVLQNEYVNSNQDNEYPIFGIDKGLKVSSLTQTKYENNDYWVVELQETGVPSAAKFFVYAGQTEDVTAAYSSLSWQRQTTGDTPFTATNGIMSYSLSITDFSIDEESNTMSATLPNTNVDITFEIPSDGLDQATQLTALSYIRVIAAAGDSAAFLCSKALC